jgi:outer membrane protein OmpA-like peptidoglycan-associated protein
MRPLRSPGLTQAIQNFSCDKGDILMKANRFRYFNYLCATLALLFALASFAMAQEAGTSAQRNSTAVASGQKMKVKGVVLSRDVDTFTVQDMTGSTVTVLLTDRTSVKAKGGFFGGGTNYNVTNILRGLNLEVEGRGDANGQLVAEKVRFNESDLRVARTVESRVDPVENRVGSAEGRINQVEQNSQRLSGQIDELAAVSNAANGGAKAAQATADAALVGVNATNERISALDDYVPQTSSSILFRRGSAVLSKDAKAQLDEVAQQALAARGYVLEVSGFASAEGGPETNRRLSQQRADTVIRYLVENHQVPLRRIITPYGYGESQPVADNKTRAGRAENRRVEVKILVNRGLTQGVTPTTSSSISPTNPQ